MLLLCAASLAALACFVTELSALIAIVVVSGLFLGVMNTALTEAVMEATELPRSVASSTYSGVRFIGGAIAPAVAGPLAATAGAAAPVRARCRSRARRGARAALALAATSRTSGSTEAPGMCERIEPWLA